MIRSAMEHKLERHGAELRALTAEQHFSLFVSALFEPLDLIEIRAIRSEIAPGTSPVTLRKWLTRDELLEAYAELASHNQSGSNIYFGVNPRTGNGGTKSDIQSCRVLWADLDECSVADAKPHWQRVEMKPSIVIDSGHGVHLYWRLEEPISLHVADNRSEIEGLLKNLYADLESDSTQDVTRLLRLPGFLNVKREPVPCRIAEFAHHQTFKLADFAAWKYQPDDSRIPSQSVQATHQENASFAAQNLQVGTTDIRRIRGLVATLDRDTDDRSRRDFWVVCQLVRLGLSAEEVCQLVQGHSKFQTDDYTAKTVQKALASVTKSAP